MTGSLEVQNMLGRYTNLSGMLDSDQFVRVIRDYLNPNLNKFSDEMQGELDYAFLMDGPKHEGVFLHEFQNRRGKLTCVYRMARGRHPGTYPKASQ